MEQIESGEYQAAIMTLNQAVNLNPGQIECYLNRGVAYSKLKSHQSAIANYNKAIQIQSNSADAYYYRGDEFLQKGEYQKALSDYHQVIQLNPNHASAYLDRGFIYAEIGETQKAVDNLMQAANLFKEKGDIQTQELALEVARQLQPDLETERLAEIPETHINKVILKEKEPVIIDRNRKIHSRSYSRPSRRSRRRGKR